MTIYLLVAWFSACFIYYGILLLLPTILSRSSTTSYNMKYISLIVMSLFEMLCFFFTKKLIDHPSFGRKRSTYLGFLILGLCSVFLIFFEQFSTLVLLGAFLIMKIFITITFMVFLFFMLDIVSFYSWDLLDIN